MPETQPPQDRGLHRLRTYDYHAAGFYWITLDTHQHACFLSDVCDGEVILHAAGQIVERQLQMLPTRTPVLVDAYVIMPNHVHVILNLLPKSEQPLEDKCAKSLGQVIQGLKAGIAAEINRQRGTPGQTVWQRNYYEHVIRGEKELNRFRSYIACNPGRWEQKNENPSGRPGM